jgi:hypothetical protein
VRDARETADMLAEVLAQLPCSHCPEPAAVYLMDMVGDRPVERLCETHWRDRVAVRQEWTA